MPPAARSDSRLVSLLFSSMRRGYGAGLRTECERLREDGAVALRAVASGCWRRVVGAYASVVGCRGFGPVEPHTEVADHVRLYDDGSGWAGRSRSLDPAGGGPRRRAAGGADAALRRGAGGAAAAPLAVGALLLRGGPNRLRPLSASRRPRGRLHRGRAGPGA